MTKAIFKAVIIPGFGPAYLPMDDDGREMVRAMLSKKKGVLLEGHAPRNPQHHRLLFALIRLVIDNTDHPVTEQDLLTCIKFATGHVERVKDHKGVEHIMPASISFVSMSQDKFSKFFDAAIQYVCADLLHGTEWETVKAEIYASLDQGYSQMRAA